MIEVRPSLVNTCSHISENVCIPTWKNPHLLRQFKSIFDFAKERNGSQKEQNPLNAADSVIYIKLENYQIFFYAFGDMRSSMRKWVELKRLLNVSLLSKPHGILLWEKCLVSQWIYTEPWVYSDLYGITLPISCLYFFPSQIEDFLEHWYIHSWNVKTISYNIYQMKHCHHKFSQAFYALRGTFIPNKIRNISSKC